MPIYEVVTDVGKDLIAELAQNMRAADVIEMQALGFTNAERTIAHSVNCSSLKWGALVDGHLAFLFGVAPAPHDPDIGIVWMLGTDLLERHARHFLRKNRDYLSQIHSQFKRLINIVHAENHVSIHWLKALGFTVESPAPYGPHGALFCRFEMRE